MSSKDGKDRLLLNRQYAAIFYVTICLLLAFITLSWVQNRRIQELLQKNDNKKVENSLKNQNLGIRNQIGGLYDRDSSMNSADTINRLRLIRFSDNQFQEVDLSNDEAHLIFIFEKPCSACNVNISFWNKLSNMLEGRVKIYGIIDDVESGGIGSVTNRVQFPLFSPFDYPSYFSTFRQFGDGAQTLLIRKGRIESILFGPLTSERCKEILRSVEV